MDISREAIFSFFVAEVGYPKKKINKYTNMKNMQDIQTQGFVVATYSDALRTAIERATQSWQAFCELPESEKVKVGYSSASAGVGYEYKKGGGYRTDRKENFDITRGGLEWLHAQLEHVDNNAVRQFVTDASAVIKLLNPIAHDFASSVEEVFGISDFTSEVDASNASFFVRFIHYFGDRIPGEETATAHVDQSGFTFHLFETDPGLQLLNKDLEWCDMPVPTSMTVIIPAMQMQLRSQDTIKALPHRVVATEQTARQGRFSAVCFVQLAETPKYDKETHGRLQEKEAGFNYTLPFGEFKNMFR